MPHLLCVVRLVFPASSVYCFRVFVVEVNWQGQWRVARVVVERSCTNSEEGQQLQVLVIWHWRISS